jgi:hypothetical protein
LNVFTGGIVGACAGGAITEYWEPKYAFLIYSFMGLFISINGLFLTAESEKEEETEDAEDETNENVGFISQTVSTYKNIKKAVLMPEINHILIYFILMGFFSPNFGAYYYYFLMNEIQIS